MLTVRFTIGTRCCDVDGALSSSRKAAVIVLAIAIACLSPRDSAAKCLVIDGGTEQYAVAASPFVPQTTDEQKRVFLTRQAIRDVLTRLRPPGASVKAGYEAKSAYVSEGRTYVARTTLPENRNPTFDQFSIVHPAELIYSVARSSRLRQLVGARYTIFGSYDFKDLDLAIPLNLAHWRQAQHGCISPRALMLLPWTVDVFPFAEAAP